MRWFVALALVASAMVAGCTAPKSSHVDGAVGAASLPPAPRSTEATDPFAASMTPSTAPTRVDRAQAIALAGKAEGLDLAHPHEGVTVSARKVLRTTEGAVAGEGDLVWLVTVDGVTIPRTGGAMPVRQAASTPVRDAHQLNIVVDAQRGIALGAYSYK